MDSIPTILQVQPATSFVGQTAYVLKTIDSTNRFASRLLLSKIKPFEGTVILAREQTAGRGQYGTSWQGAKDLNLAMSIILYPVFLPVRQAFQFNTAVSLGVLNGIRSYIQKDLYIKWPNDIYVSGRKLAGILIETSVQGSTVKDAIVGIGVNVNQMSFPAELPNPVSMKTLLHTSVDIDQLAATMMEAVEGEYLRLRSGKTEEMKLQYENSLLGFEKEMKFRLPSGQLFDGVVTGVDQSGNLCLETNEGARTFGFKEIEWVSFPESGSDL